MNTDGAPQPGNPGIPTLRGAVFWYRTSTAAAAMSAASRQRANTCCRAIRYDKVSFNVNGKAAS